jgi:hypothetical protein
MVWELSLFLEFVNGVHARICMTGWPGVLLGGHVRMIECTLFPPSSTCVVTTALPSLPLVHRHS